jgi:hypothetical protein
MLIVIMLSVIMLNVVILSVVALLNQPKWQTDIAENDWQ